MFDSLVVQFVVLWAVIDPIGSIPVYLTKTVGLSVEDRRKIARKAVIISAGILIFFLIAGQALLEAMQIPLTAFQIAGGILVFVIAMSMMGGEDNPVKPNLNKEHSSLPPEKQFAFAVVPMATPIIVGPGGFSIVIIYSSHVGTWQGALELLIACFMVGVTCYLILAGSARLSKILGNVGIKIINRVSGLLLAAIAVEIVLAGLRSLFPALKIMG